jgi:hypothetical protein
MWGEEEVGAGRAWEVMLIVDVCGGMVPADWGGSEFGAKECIWLLIVWTADYAVRTREAEAAENKSAVAFSSEPGSDAACQWCVWIVVIKRLKVGVRVDRCWITFFDMLYKLFQWLGDLVLAVVRVFGLRVWTIRHMLIVELHPHQQ